VHKKLTKFGKSPPPDPDPGIFSRIVQYYEIGHIVDTSVKNKNKKTFGVFTQPRLIV